MSKFRVGDEVRMKNNGLEWVKGDLGSIIIVDMNGDYKVKFTNVEWWFCEYEDEFELAELFTKLTEPKPLSKLGSSRLADALKKDMLLGISGDSVTIYPNPPHKHKDLIIAWANGADIESPVGDAWYSFKYPSWDDTLEYRIKQTKTPLQIEIEKCEAKLVKLKGQL